MLLSSFKLAELLFIVFILSLNNKDVIPSTAGSIMALTNISSSTGNLQLGEKISPSIQSSKNETAGKIIRLKELMDEVKFLANEIKQERRRKRKEKQTSKIESSSSSVEFRTMNREIRKLRKKMHSKFERIEERMKEMEEKIREQRKIIKKLAIQNGRSKSKIAKKKEKKNNSTSTLAPNINGEVHKVEIKRRGYEGNSCKTHNDCIPGHCCKKLDSTNSMEAVCTFYDRNEGENCEHSCVCGAQLQCFKANGAEAKPYCKKASSTDLLNGFYENSKQIF